jgi:agmatinase
MPEVLTTGARTFFGVPAAVDLANVTAQVAFLGVPFDGGTPQPGNRTGQKLGPAAARQASWEQFTYGASVEDGAAGWYDVETGRDRLRGVTMVDVGDVVIQGADDHGNFTRMREAASRIVGQGCLLVAVGGDHSISFPGWRLAAEWRWCTSTLTRISAMSSMAPVSPERASCGGSPSSRTLWE